MGGSDLPAATTLANVIARQAPDPARALRRLRPGACGGHAPGRAATERAQWRAAYQQWFSHTPAARLADRAAAEGALPVAAGNPGDLPAPLLAAADYRLLAAYLDPTGDLAEMDTAMVLARARLAPYLSMPQMRLLEAASSRLCHVARDEGIGAPGPAAALARAPLLVVFLADRASRGTNSLTVSVDHLAPPISALIAHLADALAHVVAAGGTPAHLAAEVRAALRLMHLLAERRCDMLPATAADVAALLGDEVSHAQHRAAQHLCVGRHARFAPKRGGTQPDLPSTAQADSPVADRARHGGRIVPGTLVAARAQLLGDDVSPTSDAPPVPARPIRPLRPWQDHTYNPWTPSLADAAPPPLLSAPRGRTGSMPTDRLAAQVDGASIACLRDPALAAVAVYLTGGVDPEDADLTTLARAAACWTALLLTAPLASVTATRVGAPPAERAAWLDAPRYDPTQHRLYLAPDQAIRDAWATGQRVRPAFHLPRTRHLSVHLPAPLRGLYTACLDRARRAGLDPAMRLFWVATPTGMRPLALADLEYACRAWSRDLPWSITPSDLARAGEAIALRPDAPVPPLALPLLGGRADHRWRDALTYLAVGTPTIDQWADATAAMIIDHVLTRLERGGWGATHCMCVRRWLTLPAPCLGHAPPSHRLTGSPHRPQRAALAAVYHTARRTAQRADAGLDAPGPAYARLLDLQLRLCGVRQGDIASPRRGDAIALPDGTYALNVAMKSAGDGVRRPRRIPLPPSVARTLRAYLAATEGAPNAPLLPDEGAGRGGLSHPDACRHLLTSFAAEHAADIGAPVAVTRHVQWFLGHDIANFTVGRDDDVRVTDVAVTMARLMGRLEQWLMAPGPEALS